MSRHYTLRASRLSPSSGLALSSFPFTFNASHRATTFTTSPYSFFSVSVRSKTYANVGDPACWYDDEKENPAGQWPYFEPAYQVKRRHGAEKTILKQRLPRANLFPRIPEARSTCKCSASILIFCFRWRNCSIFLAETEKLQKDKNPSWL